jgi:hypothetical protein
MADYYQMFSEVIPAITAAERAWIEQMHSCDQEPQPTLTEAGFDVQALDLDDWPGFEWEFIEANSQLWLHGDDYGNVSHVGEFVRMFLARFRPNQSWQLTWAELCSKPRISEFGGGRTLCHRQGSHGHPCGRLGRSTAAAI